MRQARTISAFTDEGLGPNRTTRANYDPLRDTLGVLHRARNLARGDELLVDTSAYGVTGTHWCECVGIAPGSASVYPYKVQVPRRGVGQYRASEVLGWRRPLLLHELLRLARGAVPR